MARKPDLSIISNVGAQLLNGGRLRKLGPLRCNAKCREFHAYAHLVKEIPVKGWPEGKWPYGKVSTVYYDRPCDPHNAPWLEDGSVSDE